MSVNDPLLAPGGAIDPPHHCSNCTNQKVLLSCLAIITSLGVMFSGGFILFNYNVSPLFGSGCVIMIFLGLVCFGFSLKFMMKAGESILNPCEIPCA